MSFSDEREHATREAYREELRREDRAWRAWWDAEAARAICEDVEPDDSCPSCGLDECDGSCVFDEDDEGGEA